jgi:homoserine kinase
VAPSLLGGAVLVLGLDPPLLVPIAIHRSLSLVLVTPDYGVSTAEARALLPREVPRADAVAQAAALGALVLALERGDGELLRAAMVDRIAEPPRRPLYRGYSEARAAALIVGALAVAVSGAGPTALAFARPERRSAVARALVEGYRSAGLGATALEAEVDREGARIVG